MDYKKQTSILRIFWLDNEPCVVHLPEKPNGYLIIYLGDVEHEVTKESSFWWEHPERRKLLMSLLDEGYTLFTSRLYGRNWGSSRAVHLLDQLYQTIIRKEILNPYIHILAEGMGALTALKFSTYYPSRIRSMVLINPCIDLKKHYEDEKSNQLFFKRLNKELEKAYEVSTKRLEEKVITPFRLEDFVTNVPIKIFNDPSEKKYPFKSHARRFEQIQSIYGNKVDFSLTVRPYFPRINRHILSFFQSYEQSLEEPL